MVAKYQLFITNMLDNHQELFDEFKRVHKLYEEDPKTYQQEFNQVGADVLDIIRRYENLLCNSSESSGYGKFSTKLSEKFQSEIKKYFPKIGFVGIE